MIDGHNDLPWAMRRLNGGDLDLIDLAKSVPELQTDIPRLRSGGVTGQFWSVFVPATLSGSAAVTTTLEQIDFVYRMVERHPETLVLARTADDVVRAQAEGRIASLIGMEGGHSIDGSLGVLRMMYALGVRYLTLAHNSNLAWVDSATDTPVLGGLSTFGEGVVQEMNRLGMLVDLSHVSADAMHHSLRVCEAPVIFSHSGARAITDVPRNVPDDVLASLRRNDGVCMVPMIPDLIGQSLEPGRDDEQSPSGGLWSCRVMERPEAGIPDVVAHIEHIREVAGVDHVGIGGDYDGGGQIAAELPDVSAYPRVFTALRSRGWSESELDRLATGNVLRVLRAAQETAG